MPRGFGAGRTTCSSRRGFRCAWSICGRLCRGKDSGLRSYGRRADATRHKQRVTRNSSRPRPLASSADHEPSRRDPAASHAAQG
jgi:hypothetical protein